MSFAEDTREVLHGHHETRPQASTALPEISKSGVKEVAASQRGSGVDSPIADHGFGARSNQWRSQNLMPPESFNPELGEYSSSQREFDIESQVADYGFQAWARKTRKQNQSHNQSYLIGLESLSLASVESLQVDLAAKLQDAMLSALPHKVQTYLPLGKMEAICRKDTVRREFSYTFGEESSDLDHYTDYICGTEDDSSGGKNDGRKIFAILVIIGQLHKINDFVEAGLKDRHLPFRKLPGGSEGSSFILAKRPALHKKRDERVTCLDTWNLVEKRKFYHNQWRLLSPYFDRASDGSVCLYELDEQSVMPWVDIVKQRNSAFDSDEYLGGLSKVTKVAIHPDHHAFGARTFAIKELLECDDKPFTEEFRNLKRVRSRDYLLSAYAAYRRGSCYSFIFPWADGGNLYDLWTTDPQLLRLKVWGDRPGSTDSDAQRTRTVITWVAGQLAGLTGTSGLGFLHDTKYSNIYQHTQGVQESERQYGFHGDIKPTNILYFDKTEGEDECGLGILKLSDFGLTGFHSAVTRSRSGPHSLTYRAPEFDMSEAYMSRKYDIWALGCVLLQLLTWLINGPEGLAKFDQSRLDELDKANPRFNEDKFFNSIPGRGAHHKSSVQHHVDRLQRQVTKGNYLFDCLELIKTRMLQINITDRASCREVHDYLTKYHKMCLEDANYARDSLLTFHEQETSNTNDDENIDDGGKIDNPAGSETSNTNDDEDIDYGGKFDNPAELRRNFTTSSHSFQRFRNKLKGLMNPPRTIEESLKANNANALKKLLKTKFDRVAIGQYAWLKELAAFGCPPEEIADLIFEQHNDSPWIFFESNQHDGVKIQPDIHSSNCAHQLVNSLQTRQSSPAIHSYPRTDSDTVTALVHELCGLAGVRPVSRDRSDWVGSVKFQDENTIACVSYGGGIDGDTYNKPLLARICEALSGFCRAAGTVQKLGLCCNCFTIAVRPTPEAGHTSSQIIHLRQLSLGLASDMFYSLEIDLNGRGNVMKSEQVLVAAKYATQIIDLFAPGAVISDSENNMESCMHACALATQLLCMAFFSYAQAHIGLMKPFFLDTPLEKIYLLGIRGLSDGISVELVDLACMGDMINSQVLTFGRPQFNNSAGRTQITSERCFVKTRVDDLLDTWGPGEFIAQKDQPGLILAIRLSRGVIWCSNKEDCMFHWSLHFPSEQLPLINVSRNPQLVIGAPVAVNNQCKTQKKRCFAESRNRIEPLGPIAPSWKKDEIEVLLQGGLYFTVQVGTVWRRIEGLTLKEFSLVHSDNGLATFLDEYWGLQVSYCTGIARRVPLYTIIADLIETFISVHATSPEEREIWENLREIYKFIDTLRTQGIQHCLRSLNQSYQKVVTTMIRNILTTLRPTGVNREEKFLIVAWPQDWNLFCCLKIPYEEKHAWAGVLADSADCATFAYTSNECLEMDEFKCTGSARALGNALSFVETSVFRSGSASEPGPRSLQHSGKYFFQKYGKNYFVMAHKPNDVAIPKIVVTPFQNMSPKMMLRVLQRFSIRIREMRWKEDQAESVTIW
ncbi:hypothetical protein F4777DRAFT_566020 [Nemania sp. FL0916]|nr:hypothetical protein F4777DRAFT_566020 [Nemania sp. FL0916]